GQGSENHEFSTHTRLMAYMDGQPLFNAANFGLQMLNDPYGEAANSTVTTTRVLTFLCPSGTIRNYLGTPWLAPLSNFVTPGCAYFASVGSSLEFEADPNCCSSAPPDGLFRDGGSAISIAGVLDGTSNTVAFGEWKIGTGNTNIVSIPQDIIFP